MFNGCSCIPEELEMGVYTPIPRVVESVPLEPEKPQRDIEITFSERTRDFLVLRAANCFLCAWILKDLEKNGKLTNYPLDYSGSPVFLAAGKKSHLKLEGLEVLNEQNQT
jgi:hypothetical protein